MAIPRMEKVFLIFLIILIALCFILGIKAYGKTITTTLDTTNKYVVAIFSDGSSKQLFNKTFIDYTATSSKITSITYAIEDPNAPTGSNIWIKETIPLE